MTKRLSVLATCLLLAAAVLVGGCGEKKEKLSSGSPAELKLMLDFFPNADHAAIYAAQAAGYFKEAGIDVKIRAPSDPSLPIKEVAAGRVDLAISYEPELLRARDQGLRVIAVGALVNKPLTSLILLGNPGVERASQLAGKKVGTAGIDYQTAYLKTIVAKAHVKPSSVHEQNVGFNLVPALAAHKVDAILGGYWNYEAVQLKLEKKRPHVLRIEKVGVPTYDELVLVANADALDRDGPKIRRFIGALSRGVRDLRRDQSSAIQGLLKANRDLDPQLQRASLKVTLPVFLPPPGKPYGWQDPGQWEAFARWMKQNGILKNGSAQGAFTNQYLPGQGL